MQKFICAVVVTYQPDPSVLQRMIATIRRQVSAVVIVDNSLQARDSTVLDAIGEAVYISMEGNKGIATAFNTGIEWARSHGCSHVLLMDQDSQPCEMMVERLSEGEDRLLAQGVEMAAVGPNYRDPKYRVLRPFSRTEKWRFRRFQCGDKDETEIIQTDFLISSGSLTRITVFDEVGGFDQGFFIDYVDMEWGLRATSQGYPSYGICGAVLEHALGEDAITFWFLKTWSVPLHKAFRHYYCFRNALLLYRRPYVPLVWKLRDLFMLFLKAVFFSTVPSPRLERFKMISLGVYDGLRNRSGPFRSEREA